MLYRFVYSASVVVICCLVIDAELSALGLASRIGAPWPTLAAMLVAGATYAVLNRALVSAAIVVSGVRPRPGVLLGSRAENVFELTSLALGGMLAGCLITEPWFAVLVLPAAFLLQHHALLRQLVDAATKDTKTELLNASAWRRVAERELVRAQRQHLPAAVLMVDLDHFKRINDTYGHLAGDTALRAVSTALAEELRNYDAVGRFGGEEFVALLPGVGGAQALHVAERIRHRIAGLHLWAGPQRGAFTVTASVGAAALHEHGADLDTLVQAADDAVYAAKASGRDACRLAAPATVVPLLARTA